MISQTVNLDNASAELWCKRNHTISYAIDNWKLTILGVINMCFMLLFRDLIRLFACYNDGIINLLEKYFDMNKKQCKDALDLYKRFLVRMDRVGEFLKVAEVSSKLYLYIIFVY